MPWPKYVWNACVMGEWLTQSLYYSLQIRFVFIILLPSLNLCTKLNPVNYTFQFYAINTRGKYETNFLRVNLNLNIFQNNNTAVKLPSKFFWFSVNYFIVNVYRSILHGGRKAIWQNSKGRGRITDPLPISRVLALFFRLNLRVDYFTLLWLICFSFSFVVAPRQGGCWTRTSQKFGWVNSFTYELDTNCRGMVT
jgi:hypothetical protein